MNKYVLAFFLITVAYCKYSLAYSSEEVYLKTNLSLICVGRDVMAKIVIKNDSGFLIKLNRFDIGENGYIFSNIFKVKNLESNARISFSGATPELVLDESIYKLIKPTDNLIYWFNVSKLYSLNSENKYLIQYKAESLYHRGKEKLVRLYSQEENISCKNTNPLFM